MAETAKIHSGQALRRNSRERVRRHLPPGWQSNPSSWPERLSLVGLALVGFVIAAYLSFYQLGILEDVWEPFFGAGSRTVLTSRVSHIVPIPDAALGAFGYLLDAVTGMIGGAGRLGGGWRGLLFA